jgi:hypothetical protein
LRSQHKGDTHSFQSRAHDLTPHAEIWECERGRGRPGSSGGNSSLSAAMLWVCGVELSGDKPRFADWDQQMWVSPLFPGLGSANVGVPFVSLCFLDKNPPPDVSHAGRHWVERWGVTRNEDIGFSGRRFDLVVRPLHSGISGPPLRWLTCLRRCAKTQHKA